MNKRSNINVIFEQFLTPPTLNFLTARGVITEIWYYLLWKGNIKNIGSTENIKNIENIVDENVTVDQGF